MDSYKKIKRNNRKALKQNGVITEYEYTETDEMRSVLNQMTDNEKIILLQHQMRGKWFKDGEGKFKLRIGTKAYERMIKFEELMKQKYLKDETK